MSEAQGVGRPMSAKAEDAEGAARVTPYAWYALGVLTLVWTFNQIDRRVLSLLLEPIKTEFQLSDSQLGLLTGLAFGAPYALAVIPIGMAVDRVNRRNLLAVMLFLWSGMTALGGFARSFLHLLVVRAFVGASEAGCTPTALSLISDLFPKEKRTTAVALFETANGIGAIICFTVGGFVAAAYGWRAAFLVAGVPGMVLAFLVVLSFREPKRGQMEAPGAADQTPVGEKSRPLAGTFRLLATHRSIGLILLGCGLVAAGNVGIMGWVASFLIRLHGLDVKQAGLAIALISGVCSGIGILASGLWTERIASGNAARTLAASAGFVGLTLATAIAGLLAPTLLTALIAFALYGLVHNNFVSLAFAVLLNQSPTHLRGTLMACTTVMTNLCGYAGGPVVVGVLSDSYGGADSLRWALMTITGFYVVAGLIFARTALVERRAVR